MLGHYEEVLDCDINNELGIVASCATQIGIVHSLQSQCVLFSFGSIGESSQLEKVCISPRGYIVAHGFCDSSSYIMLFTVSGQKLAFREIPYKVTAWCFDTPGDVLLVGTSTAMIHLYHVPDLQCIKEYWGEIEGAITSIAVGPSEVESLAVAGYESGDHVFHLLPDADGSVSMLGTLEKLLDVQLKMVKDTVQHAQYLANNARAATNTASAIAGEAIGEAKSIVRGIIEFAKK